MENPSPFDLLQGAAVPFSQLTDTKRFDRWREIQSISPRQQPVSRDADMPASRQEAPAPAADERPVPTPEPEAKAETSETEPEQRGQRPAPAPKPHRNYYDSIIQKHTLAANQTVFIPVTKP